MFVCVDLVGCVIVGCVFVGCVICMMELVVDVLFVVVCLFVLFCWVFVVYCKNVEDRVIWCWILLVFVKWVKVIVFVMFGCLGDLCLFFWWILVCVGVV